MKLCRYLLKLAEVYIFLQNIFFSFFFLLSDLTSQHVGSLFLVQGLNPCPLHWKHRALTTGPLDKSHFMIFSDDCFLSVKFKKLISIIDFSFKIKDNLKKHSL